MRLLFFALSIFLLSLAPQAAHANLEIDVTSGVVEPMPIAVTNFNAEAPENQNLANDLPQIIATNLQRSGLFNPVNPRAYVQDPASIEKQGVRLLI